MFPAAVRWAIWTQICGGSGTIDALLYLRHLREETDGDRQGEAEGQQTHEAVNGQHQPAVPLQESQPACGKKRGKKNCVNLLRASVPGDDCGLFLDAGKASCSDLREAILYNWWV